MVVRVCGQMEGLCQLTPMPLATLGARLPAEASLA